MTARCEIRTLSVKRSILLSLFFGYCLMVFCACHKDKPQTATREMGKKTISFWNGFFWPLIVTNSLDMRTLPIGLAILNGQWWSEQHLLMAAAFTCGFPIFILYLLFENQIEKGVAAMSFR